MLQVDDKIISLDVFTGFFCCHLKKCRGLCCVHGDSGAPLEKKEAKILKRIYPEIKKFLTPEGRNKIESTGISMIDKDNDLVTPLIDQKACAYINYYKNGISYCSIEKAFFDKKITFQKPVSCHLYPLRIKKYKDFTAVNYDRWDICKPAISLGRQKKMKVFEFCKDGLIRSFGEEFYRQLQYADQQNIFEL